MENLLKNLEEQKNWKEFLKKSCRKNKINVDIAGYFTPNKIRIIYERFLKIYQTKPQQDSACWLQNQLKSFHWIITALSGLGQCLIQDFTQIQWLAMKQIFKNKDQSIMEYQAIKLVDQRLNKNRLWTHQETQVLTDIIKQNQNSNKWNDIARKLFQRSKHAFFRSGKQCRERWLNHLDPNKKRGQWEQSEDKLIVGFILNFGRRWSNIAKQLGNHRTEHMVKNRFKTLIIKQRKLTPKIANQNSLLRQIGKKLIGQDKMPVRKRQYFVKKQDRELNSIEQQQSVSENEQNSQKQQMKYKKTDIIIPQAQVKKQSIFSQGHQSFAPKQQYVRHYQQQLPIFCDPIINHVMQDSSKGVSTPMGNYELQQIFSPFYIMTPYLSPSPSVPFFMNSSFSAFDNQFNQSLFIRSNNHIEKRQENE